MHGAQVDMELDRGLRNPLARDSSRELREIILIQRSTHEATKSSGMDGVRIA